MGLPDWLAEFRVLPCPRDLAIILVQETRSRSKVLVNSRSTISPSEHIESHQIKPANSSSTRSSSCNVNLNFSAASYPFSMHRIIRFPARLWIERRATQLSPPIRRTFTMSSTAYSTTGSSKALDEPLEQAPTSDQSQQEPVKERLALPAIGEGSVTQLDVSGGGSSVKLDHLGPMVVNQDGTLSRISNWDQMTEFEQKNTLRVLTKRNRERLDVLKAAEEGKGS